MAIDYSKVDYYGSDYSLTSGKGLSSGLPLSSWPKATSGVLPDTVGSATLTVDEIPEDYRTSEILEVLPSNQSGKSTVDPGNYSPSSGSSSPVFDFNLFGTSASAQNPVTPQPYSFMDTSLASMFGMDAATQYQEALANTAYQRQVRDLKAAGLNPVLGMSGNGAAVFRGTADPLAGLSFGSSGGSSYGSSGSGKSTSDIADTATKLQYWLPVLANGVVNMVVSHSKAGKKNPFAGYGAGMIAQNITSGILGAIRNHVK